MIRLQRQKTDKEEVREITIINIIIILAIINTFLTSINNIDSISIINITIIINKRSNGGEFVCEKCKFETSEKGKMKEHNREKHKIFEYKNLDKKSSSEVGLMKHSKKAQEKQVEDIFLNGQFFLY